MELREARALVMDLMTLHGVDHADYEWMNKKNRHGEVQFKAPGTAHATITLRLSRDIIRLQPRDEVEQTILHEIAHILAGPEHGHDWTWKSKARAIGYTGERTANVPDEHHAAQNWVGCCPAGHLSSRTRAPRPGRKTSCGRCSRRYDERYLIEWVPGHLYRAAQSVMAAQETTS